MKSLRTYHKQNRQKLEFNIIYMFANCGYGLIMWNKNCFFFLFFSKFYVLFLKTRVDPEQLASNEAS